MLYKKTKVLETEAETVKWAIQTLVGFGYSNVSVETDFQVLVRMLNGEEEIWPKLRPIVQEISVLLTGSEGFEVVYYFRSDNKVADRIAKEITTFTSFVPKLYSVVSVWLSLLFKADKPIVKF